ncbi:DNA-binding beta-propeller fold protein YncE [Mucilaginibacter sp. OK098]|nr:DNA-binding beta-propeller fold protein YncE [Mucilaginibacter sp. OK098]
MNKILLFGLLLWSASTSAQSKLVAVQQYRDSVVIFDLKSQIKTGHVKIGFKPHEITYDAVTKKCFISNFGLEDYDLRIGKTGNVISVVDPFVGKLVKELYTAADTAVHNGPHGIKVRQGKYRELFVNTEIGGDSMLVFDTQHLIVKRKFALPKGTHNFSFSPRDDSLWVMAGQNGVYRIDPENGAILQHMELSSPVRGLLIAKQWIVASCKNEIFLLSKTDLSILKHFSNLQLKVGLILYSNITDDQKYILAPAPFDSVVLVIDAATGEVMHRLQTGDTPINVQVSGMRAYVSHAKDDYIGTIDLGTFKVSKDLKAFGTNGLIVIK